MAVTTQQEQRTEIRVGEHTVELRRIDGEEGSRMEAEVIESPILTSIEIRYNADVWRVRATDQNTSSEYDIACIRRDGEGLHLYHLDVPFPSRGEGLGKTALAILYGVAQLYDYHEVSMKFGGGESGSYEFLVSLGFNPRDIEVVQDTDNPEPSVVFGDVEYRYESDDKRGWSLHHTARSCFPTEFFKLNAKEPSR